MARLIPPPLPKPQIPRNPSSVWDEATEALNNRYEQFRMIDSIPRDDSGIAAPIEGRTELKRYGNPEEGHISNLEYLNRVNNPEGISAKDGVTIGVDSEKNVWAIPKGENKYYRLDPPFLSKNFYKDLGNDAKDIGYDFASAIPTTAIGIGTAALLGSSWPALLAGGLVAGATGATAEGIRQMKGDKLGMENNPENIKLMGATNALAPAFFKRMQRFVPASLSALSGTPVDAVKAGFNYLPTMAKIEAAKATPWAEDVWERTIEPIIKKTQAHGKNLDTAINAAGKKVNIAEAKTRLYGVMQRYETKMLQQGKNPQLVEAYERAKNAYIQAFGQAPKDITEEFLSLSPQKQQELLQMEEVVQKTVDTGLKDASGNPIVSTRYDRVILPDEMIPSSAYDKSKAIALQKGDYKVSDTKPSIFTRFLKGPGSSISDDPVLLALDQAKKHIDKGLDDVTNGMSSNHRAEYARYMRMRRILDNHFNDKQQAWSTLRNMNQALSKQELRDLNDEILKETGVDLKREGSLVAAHHFFGNPGTRGNGPSLLPLNAAEGTSTMRAGLLGTMGFGLGTLGTKVLGDFAPGSIQIGQALPYLGVLGANVGFSPAGLKAAMYPYYYSKLAHPAIRTGATGMFNDSVRKYNPWTLMNDDEWADFNKPSNKGTNQ